MTNYPYILFNQTPEDLRRIGARGGRAYGRNCRDRRAQGSRPLEAVARPVPQRETTAEAIGPWMRSLAGCEVREIAPPGTADDLVRFVDPRIGKASVRIYPTTKPRNCTHHRAREIQY